MNIGMILDNEFTGDIRVENEIISLTKAGYKVFLLCLNFGKKKKHEEFYGAKISRIRIPLQVKKKLAALNNSTIDLYSFFWSRNIRKFIGENSISVLHVHDLWLLNAALKANVKYNLPVISDLHENFVFALNHYKYANTFPGNLLISKKRWADKEPEWCKKADYIITVIEEAVERYKAQGVDGEKISVVANYVNLNTFAKEETDSEIINKFSKYNSLTYVGGFDIHRGLDSVIKAVPLIIDEIKNFRLILVGKGSNYEDLKRLAKKLNVEDYIYFEGWKPHSLLSSYIDSSKVCIIPHLKTVHTDNTIPHKLFQYMLLRKPVISSDCNPLKRILNETKAGLIYKSNDHTDLSEKIIYLFNHNEEMKEMGESGHRWVYKKYNWDKTAENLISIYRKIQMNKKVS